jgi:hypothetical protein
VENGMLKRLHLALVSSVLLAAPAIAAPNLTPKPSGSSQSCRCACFSNGGVYAGDKILTSYSGTRAGCQALSGASCALSKPDSSGNSYGSTRSCDIILVKTAPKATTGPRPAVKTQ